MTINHIMAEKPDEYPDEGTDEIPTDPIVVSEEINDVPQPKKPESLTIFVVGKTGVGKTGVGKSSLINSLLGKDIAIVSDGIHATNHEPIEKHSGEFCGIPTVFYDTRGLGDSRFDYTRLTKKLKETIAKHGDRYLIFICQRFEDRLDDSFVLFVAMGKIITYGGKALLFDTSKLILFKYKHHPLSSEEEQIPAIDAEKVKILIIMTERSLNFKRCLTNNGVPEEIILRMPVCPTAIDETEIALYESWKEKLMEICIFAEQDLEINDKNGNSKKL